MDTIVSHRRRTVLLGIGALAWQVGPRREPAGQVFRRGCRTAPSSRTTPDSASSAPSTRRLRSGVR